MIDHAEFILASLTKLKNKHRHVAIRLESTWGTRACHNEFSNLLSKPNSQGFDSNVYSMLVLMYSVHVNQYGDYGCPMNLSTMNINLDSLELNDKIRMTDAQAANVLQAVLTKKPS